MLSLALAAAGFASSYALAVGPAATAPTTTVVTESGTGPTTTEAVTLGTSSTESETTSTLTGSTQLATVTQATTAATATGDTLAPAAPSGQRADSGEARVTVESGATLDSFALEPGRLPVTAEGRPILERLTAFPARFVGRFGSEERGTTLTFFVAAPGRLQFTVLGKGPGCKRLGSFARRVHRGTNRIRFSGRLGGRALPPGRYTIVAELVRGNRRIPLASVTLVILSPAQRAAIRPRTPVRGECRLAALKNAPSDTAGVLGARSGGPHAAGQAGEPQPSGSVAGVSRTQLSAAKRDPMADWPILSAILPDDPPGPPYLLGIVALAGLVLCIVALIAFLVRFLKRSAGPLEPGL